MESPSLTFIIVFYLLTFMTLVSGAMATFAKNIVTAAYALFFTLLGLSGYFVLLGSDFMAVVQVVVYVGGILTLLLFGILLTNRSYRQVSGEQETANRLPAIILGIFTLGIVLTAVFLGDFYNVVPVEHPDVPAFAPKTSELGAYLLSRHLLAFELAGMTLLGALLGAAYLVRKKDS
jgi:NADH-quinone oxidoreductase subunit J